MTKLEEKYRPKTLDEVIGNREIIEKIKERLEGDPSQFPNMFFSGPPGVGKTTVARIIARHFAGKNYLVMNSFDKSSVSDLRNDVIEYVKTVGFGGKRRVVIFEEVDNMSYQAKEALRGIMDKYSNALYILTTNYVQKISDAVISRITHYRFKPLSSEDILVALRRVNNGENFGIPEETLVRIAKNSGGDLRKAIHSLLSPVTPSSSKNILAIALKKGFREGYKSWITSGIGAEQFMRESAILIAESDKISLKKAMDMVEAIADAEYYISIGVRHETVMMSLMSKLYKIYRRK